MVVELVGRFHRDGLFLDVGGGNGYVAKALISAGIHCVLIEPGVDGALAARARGVDPVICARLEDVELPAGCARSVGLFDVLEHIEHEAAALNFIHSILEPSGHLFLTVPSYELLYSSEDAAAGHFRRYTTARLHRVLAKSSFRIVFSTYIFAPLPPLILFSRTIPTRLGIRQGRKLDVAAAELAPSGPAVWLMDRILDLEFSLLRAGRRCPFGGSCLCVAVRE